ncbi:uncharacterized protein M421DRAFT_416530 [Didymella exigua CBS 183.55]|uniref:Uncharacterized protein n=1 Tax=Didymella exigua CBS 183.55 TaxID=1150837 RepID=A0A6A5RZA0_9PLEO|nr:uncharacterized protein M421DRAFT_416530 [Didymella exigua CBS 183.55]KAF1932933.1 hypothetical protein M421DRAFT_416530 [Didymella exigua CBS 183.55]
MSSRRPLQPIPAPPVNVWSTRYACITTTTTTKAADGTHDMADHVLDDMQESGSIGSGLTSLSGDDDFERRLIQNARDERRLRDARNDRAQPFRKARTHPRVGLTIDNLERNEAQNDNTSAATARVAIKSPPSSSGSMRSGPPVHAPASWGRKGRTDPAWLRNMRRDEQQPQQTAAPPEDTMAGQHDNGPLDDGPPSPLSHKGPNPGNPGTQRHDVSGEWDLTFDMNEASMLVSTPYVPRNTMLDDIREREMESLHEQGATAARLDRIWESSAEEKRRPAVSANTARAEAQSQDQGSPTQRLRTRTNSWQSLSRSQPELGKENSPIAVYRKSMETVGVVDGDVVASADRRTPRPFSNRRTDSQDLLRRLARASNTPSPKETRPARPQTDPAPQQHSSSQTAIPETSYTKPGAKDEPVKAMPAEDTAKVSNSTPQEQAPREHRHDTPHDGTTPDVPSSAPTTGEVEATPLPVERSLPQPKTPYVVGGWLDTPGPRTSHRPAESHREPSQSSEKGTSKSRSLEQLTVPKEAHQPVDDVQGPAQSSPPRPQLPDSALHALVQEARANHDYGDDTLHSLEDLMTPRAENETEEDTLQGLPLPTSAPRSEAERLRHAEIVDLHRLNQHLRATRTGIRDISRGMRRVGTTVEHTQVDGTSEKLPVLVRDLGHDFSPWTWFRSFFWDERLKTQRRYKNAHLKMWGGVTLFGISLTLSFIWWASETVACEMFCHPEYARYSPYPFAVNMDAPKRGIVIPTLVYRALFESWPTHIVSPLAFLLSWLWTSIWTLASGVKITGLSQPSHVAVYNGGPAMAVHTQASWKVQEEVYEENSRDWSMAEDEVLRR